MAPRLFVPAVDSDPQTITAAPTFAPTLDERDDLKDEQIAAWFSRPGVDNWAQIICESPSAYTSSGAFAGCWKTTDSTVVLPTGCSNNYVQYPKQSSTACTGDNKCGVFTIFASQSATATSHLFYECLPTDWDPPIPATWYRTTWPSISVPEPTSTSRLTSITTKTKFKTVTSSSATPTSKPTPTTSSTSTSVPGSQAAITPISIDSRTATSRTTFGFGLGSTSVAPSTTASGTSAGSRQIRPMLNLGGICSINVILMWVFLG